jgi:DNA repair exonuclease SbcCD ATPase subunit
MLGTISETMRNLFGPQAINGALAHVPDELGEAHAIISQATAEIRRRLGERKGLERDFEAAKEREQTIREQLDLVAPALERVKRARDTEAADRRSRMESGAPGSDPKLVAEVEAAECALREVTRNAEAAEAALPALEEQTRDAQAALGRCAEGLDAAVWRRRVAEVSRELPEVRAAAAVLAAFSTRVEALKDVALRHKLYGTPNGSVPGEFSSLCSIAKPREFELRPVISAEIAYLRRLREDPDVAID